MHPQQPQPPGRGSKGSKGPKGVGMDRAGRGGALTPRQRGPGRLQAAQQQPRLGVAVALRGAPGGWGGSGCPVVLSTREPGHTPPRPLCS